MIWSCAHSYHYRVRTHPISSPHYPISRCMVSLSIITFYFVGQNDIFNSPYTFATDHTILIMERLSAYHQPSLSFDHAISLSPSRHSFDQIHSTSYPSFKGHRMR